MTTRSERDVVARKIRLVEHRHDRGRRRGDVGDPLALDELERRLGREALEQHGPAAADDRLQQAQIAPVETRPADRRAARRARSRAMSALIWRTAGRVVLNECSTHLGLPVVPEVKAMRKISSALMRTRSAGASGARRRRCRARGSTRRLPASPATTTWVRPRDAFAQLARHGHVVEALERVGADEGAAAGEAQDVVELAHAEVGIDLVGDGADQLERKEDDREGDAVRQLDGDDVAALDADAAQECRAALDLVLQLAVGDARLPVDEHLAVGMRSARALRISKNVSSRHCRPCASAVPARA